MWSNLTRTVPPDIAVEVLPLADVKTHMRVGADYLDDDIDIQAKIDAAIGKVDGPKGIGIAMLTQTWRMSLRRWENPIHIGLQPVQSIVSITYIDTTGALQTLDPSLYNLDTDQRPAVLEPAFGTCWPCARDQAGAIKINFVAGYGALAAAVPAPIIQALKLLVAHWYANREAVVGVESRDSSTELPLGVQMLLDDYQPPAL